MDSKHINGTKYWKSMHKTFQSKRTTFLKTEFSNSPKLWSNMREWKYFQTYSKSEKFS